MTSEELDTLWDYNAPDASRLRFEAILDATSGPFRAEVLTQIARCYGLAGRFEEGHQTLDRALSESPDPVGEARISLERGRLLRSSGTEGSQTYFQIAEEQARNANALFYEIDAIHMRALVEPDAEGLAQLGLVKAEASSDARCRRWRIALNSNPGWAYYERGDYQKALASFDRCLQAAVEWGDPVRINHAYWYKAHTLISLNQLAKAREMFEDLTYDPNCEPEVYADLADVLFALQEFPAAREAALHVAVHRFQTMSDEDLKYESFFRHLYLAPPSKSMDFTVDYDGPQEGLGEMIIKSWRDADLRHKATPDQIGRALWESHGNFSWNLETFEAAKVLFRETLDPLASDRLGHQNECANKFDGALYMFWDSATWYASRSDPPDQPEIGAFIEICQFCLDSEKAGMQESALHGLGHNAYDCKAIREVIVQYLRQNRPARKELIAYAKNARRGMIQ